MQDKTSGGLLLLSAIASFAYFIVWVFFTPFMPVDDKGVVKNWFPPRVWATTGFISTLVAAMVVYGIAVGSLLVRDRLPRIERCR